MITSVDKLRVKVVYQGEGGFVSARDTFLRYRDKAFSLTDCASFNTMRAHGISEAFTFDRHFAQVGFVILR